MDTQRCCKPTWALLFTLGPPAASLLFLTHYQILFSPWRRMVEITIVFIVCGLAEVWTRLNSDALLDYAPSKAKREVTGVSQSVLLAPPPTHQISAEDAFQIFRGPAELAESSGADNSEFGLCLTPLPLYRHFYGDENPSPSLN
jgi:hypothetical protein